MMVKTAEYRVGKSKRHFMCSYGSHLHIDCRPLYIVIFVSTETCKTHYHLLPKTESSFRPTPLCSMTDNVALALCPSLSLLTEPELPLSATVKILVLVLKPTSTSCFSLFSISLLNRFKISFILSLPIAFLQPSIAALIKARFFFYNLRIRALTVLIIVNLQIVTSTI